MTPMEFGLATPSDDADLRRLLRECHMPGAVSVSFEREPDYFRGARIEGPYQQTIIARDTKSNRIIGMASRAIRDLYADGIVQSVGYLSQVRIAPGYRSMRRALLQAFGYVRSLHEDGRASFHYTSMVADNLPARRLFSAGLPGMPKVQEYARLHTIAVLARRRRHGLRLPKGLRFQSGDRVPVRDIVQCLQRYCRRYQLAPYWTEDLLFSPEHTPDLSRSDFVVALDGGRVVGCLATWDQRRFKQSVVRGYSGSLGRWRGLVNVASRLAGRPTLPPINTPFCHCYASFLAVVDDRPDVFEPLLRSVYNRVVDQGFDYLMIGLGEGHPFVDRVRSTYAHIDFESVLYLVAWGEETKGLLDSDGRIAGAEIAIL